MIWRLALALLVDIAFRGGIDHPVIGYNSRAESNPVVERRAAVSSFRFGEKSGYLRSVLDALDVPVESQIVVFSKTSLMQRIITPRNPRSIFFNDTTAVAWVPGEPFVEVAVQDAVLGAVFYTVAQDLFHRPEFGRSNSCLTCHESLASEGVPGMLVRSVHPDAEGRPIRALGDFVTDHRSPFGDRWGGWFVTGRQLPPQHLGETKFPDGLPLLTRHSDVVALMVFDHQMGAINRLTRAGWDARLALHEGKPELLPGIARELADYLLFVGEAPLPGPVEGASGFAAKFAARGPLREFDLQRRLFRYRCSYMVYSPAFDALPAQLREAVYRRMWDVLGTYPRDERTAIVRTLRDTKKDLPSYFLAPTPN
jgi:hypothetical protein